jgi:sialate O-acetylesterase
MKPKIPALNAILTCLALALIASSSRGDVRLHGLFSDNMILQQNASVPIWGWADDGEKITVEFRGQKVSAKTSNGKWMVRLKAMKAAGAPAELKVSGKNSLTLKNVLVGEVWIASGQSNMEWPLRSSFEAEKDIAASANAMIRLYTVPKLKANAPTNNVPASWQECGPQSSPGFSAVAYYFARDLQKALGVPVGVIHTSWGGSPAEVWMSEETLSRNAGYKRDILDTYADVLKRTQDSIAQYEKESAQAKQEGKPFSKRRPGMPWKPTELYNGMIAPLIPYAIQGAIWYQGESNAGRAWQYRTLFADMIRNWRRDWGQGDFSFLEVQLAPFMPIKEEPAESSWAELREAQVLATKALPKTGIAVITDVGEEKDIHPKKKEPVGARLALAARGIAYGEKIVYSGPAFKSMKVDGNQAVLSFNHVGAGLEAHNMAKVVAFAPDGKALATNVVDTGRNPGAKSATFSPDGKQVVTTGGDKTVRLWDVSTGREISSPLKGFSICGEDKKFVWANAEIKGNQVIVSSPAVSKPVAVRYGWADFPVVNLWNKEGLPASPFRTDDFPMTTAPKQ